MSSFSITVKRHLTAACERAWGAYVWSLQLIVYTLLAYTILNAVAAYLLILLAPQPDSAAFVHARLPGRGVTRPIFRVPVVPLFHPHARPIVFGGPPTSSMTRLFLDRFASLLAEATVLALSTVTNPAELMKRAYGVYTGAVNAAVAPLNTRLNRGIVQLSALPNIPVRQAALRYLRSLPLLVGVFISLLVFAGPSLKWAMAFSFCSLVLVVGGVRRVGRQDFPAPGMANAGLVGALEARAGARAAA